MYSHLDTCCFPLNSDRYKICIFRRELIFWFETLYLENNPSVMDTNQDKNFIRTCSEFIEKLPSEILVRDVEEITTELTTVVFEANSQEMIKCLPKFVYKICEFGRVQEVQCKDTDIVGVDDFRNVETKASETMRCLIIILEKVRQSFGELGAAEKAGAERRLTNVLGGIVIPILILIGEQHGDYMWTSRESVKLSQTLMKVLLALCQCSTVDMLLSSLENRSGSLIQSEIFSKIMNEIKPRLRKDNWKRNPSLVRVCVYYLDKVSKSDNITYEIRSKILKFFSRHERTNSVKTTRT